MTQRLPQAAHDPGIQVLSMPDQLDCATADSLAAQGCRVVARRARVLLLDLTGLSFCDAYGLRALVRIANRADAAGCRYGLIAPRPQVATLLQITGLNQRMPVFGTVNAALTGLTAAAAAAPAVVAG